MPNVETVLRDHVTLNVDCIDRIYLNAFVPRLQRPENLWWFLTKHRGWPVVSPVLLKRLSDEFIARIHGFAKRNNVPIVKFEKGARKEDVAQEHLARFKAQEGVVMIGVAQEQVGGFRYYQKGRRGRAERRSGRPPCYAFFRGQVHVNQYYFYIFDRNFGLCFIKFSSYVPFGVKLWLNGHEWAKRQLDGLGIRYDALENGFFACDEPDTLQDVCDELGAQHIEAFFRKWLSRL